MKKGLVVSDLHCGSLYGLLPPGFVTFEGVEKKLNVGQVYLWDCWADFCQRAKEFQPDFVIANGDLVDGPQKKNSGSELSLITPGDQSKAAVETLRPLRKATGASCKWYFTQGCFVPGTKVLTDDLEWVSAENLEPGRGIFSFESSGPYRHWQRSHVTATEIRRKPVSEVTFSDGTKVVATDDHPWLCIPWVGSQAQYWRRTREFRPGFTRIHRLRQWEPSRDYETGWLAGIFDGEGTWHRDSGISSFTQNAGPVLERALAHIERLGFRARVDDKRPNDITRVVSIAGGISENLRFLGTVRPGRILERNKALNQCLKFRNEELTVTAVRSLGEEEIVAMSTSSGTYFAEGFGAHNTPYHVGNFGDAEEEIAHQCTAEKYHSVGTGKYCREVLWLKTEGVIIEAAHHVSGTTGFYRLTGIDREMQWSAMAGKDDLKGVPKADLLVRSHLHHFVSGEHASKQGIVTPCWQLQTRYARKHSVSRLLPDIGGILLTVDGEAKKRGEAPVSITKELYRLPQIRLTEL